MKKMSMNEIVNKYSGSITHLINSETDWEQFKLDGYSLYNEFVDCCKNNGFGSDAIDMWTRAVKHSNQTPDIRAVWLLERNMVGNMGNERG